MNVCRSKARRSRTAGFGLIELLVAVLLLTIGVLSLAAVLGSVTRRQAIAAGHSEMMRFADAKLEEMRATSAAGGPDLDQIDFGGSLITATAPHADTVSGRGERAYERLWWVVDGPGGTREVTLRIRPTVTSSRTPPTLDFTTYILVP